MSNRSTAALASLIWLAATAALAQEATPVECGLRPTDWCEAPAGDPCGEHKDAYSCEADPKCYGIRYRGESLIACQYDERGFAENCPTVGCTSTPPTKPGE